MIIGVIGGSGLYSIDSDGENLQINTPYGPPSSFIFRKQVGENQLVFLARHGEGHRLLPSEVNYRANVFAMKKVGAQILVSVSAVGSLSEEISPGDFVLPAQYLDRTSGTRPSTFFGRGIVAHAHFADPSCLSLRNHLSLICKELGIRAHVGGSYVCMEGPQFSTRTESHWYRSFRLPENPISVIGMTALPEAKLAREAGLCYQTVAMATDYDCWNARTEDVSVDSILRVLEKNVDRSQKLLRLLVEKLGPKCEVRCANSMKTAIVTPSDFWPKDRCEEMKVLLAGS